jgi:ClpP class serine protease
MTEDQIIQIQACINELAENADVFFYSGPISYSGYDKITKLCRMTEPRRNVVLILTTLGGDPHAAYRIARALRHNYDKLHLFILRECKSAGTLLAIGATELIISDRGELGPLDVQISKPDEMFERNSGLDVTQALRAMQSEAFDAFRSYMLDIKLGSGITLRASAEIATKLVVDLFPI